LRRTGGGGASGSFPPTLIATHKLHIDDPHPLKLYVLLSKINDHPIRAFTRETPAMSLSRRQVIAAIPQNDRCRIAGTPAVAQDSRKS